MIPNLGHITLREPKTKTKVRWRISERVPGTDLWFPVVEGYNLMTEYGLTNLAAAFGGAYASPDYLVIDNFSAQIQNAGTLAAGATSVTLDKRVDQSGDTQIVLGSGTGNEETVSFSAVSGGGPYVYTISATVNTHAQNDYVVRAPRATDTIATIQSEVQYAPVTFPNKRALKTGTGYSGGTGNHVMSFFITGSQAIGRWESLGTSESDTVGAGNLHNHLVIGYDHVSGNDTQIDISLTLTNTP